MALGVLAAIFLSILITFSFVRYNVTEGMERKLSNVFLSISGLIDQRLSHAPYDTLRDELRHIQTQSPFPIDIVPPNHETIPESVKADLANGTLRGALSDAGYTIYSPFRKNQYVLVYGPLPKLWQPTVALRLMFFGILASILLILTLLLGYPLVRRLRDLEKVTEKFGKGQLDERAAVSGQDGIDQLAGRFNQMADRIQILLESQSNMLQAVSHELRTPLSRIRFKLERLEPADDRKAHENPISPIERDLDVLEGLIDDLLIFHRVETDTSVVFDEIDAKPFFHSVVEKYKSENDSKIEIEMVPDLRESMKFSGSSTLLRLALINLLANGARYAHSRVLVNLREEGGNIVIIVENDGPPIPEAQRNAIFEPFFRLDTSRSRETGGTGLGLAIVKKVVDMHRGQVSVVQSDLGGARFELILPCS
jgi:two-component system sensor histidine kinase RstB